MAASPRSPTTGSSAAIRNRFVAGVNVLNGTIDARQFVNVGGFKGTPTSSLLQKPENYSLYAENSFYFLPQVAFVAGTQYLFAVRDQLVNFSTNGDVNRPQHVQPLEPEGGTAVGRRSDMAGVRQYLAQRRGAELRRERQLRIS